MRRAYVASDEEIRAKLKHNAVLQDYLQLQKEYVSKKRKLRAIKQKRETLLGEIGFLRQRRRNLLEVERWKPEFEEDRVQPQNSDMPRKLLEKKMNHNSVNEAPLGNSSVLVSNPDTEN